MRGRRAAWLMLGIAACSSGAGAKVEVYATTNELGSIVPLIGAPVVFQDPGGHTTSAMTDANGHATGEVERGGTVWLASLPQSAGNMFVAYPDVQPPSTLYFGPPAPPTQVAAMTVSAQPPPMTTSVIFYPSCGSHGSANQLLLDDSCGSSVDVLAVAFTNSGGTSYGPYALVTAQPIVDGGTITFPTNAWKPLDTVEISFTNLDGATVKSVGVANAFGFTPTMAGSGSSFSTQLPLVGSALDISLDAERPSGGQTIRTRIAAASSVTVDLQAVAAPWMTSDGATWTADDDGGVLVATATVLIQQWDTPTGYADGAYIVGPPKLTGTIPAVSLPSELAKYQPQPNWQVNSMAQLWRISGPRGIDPLETGAPTMSYVPSFTLHYVGDVIANSSY